MQAAESSCCLTIVMCLCSIVHQHIFEVMKLAFKEILTSEEQTQKAFVLWSTFVEPLFGLQPHKREEWELDQKQSNAAQQHHLRRNPSLRATAVSGESLMRHLWRRREEQLKSPQLVTRTCTGAVLNSYYDMRPQWRMQPGLLPYRSLIWRRAGAGEPGNDSEAEAHSAMGGGDDADDVTTEMVGPARTNDAASAMMEAVAKVI